MEDHAKIELINNLVNRIHSDLVDQFLEIDSSLDMYEVVVKSVMTFVNHELDGVDRRTTLQ